MPKYKKAKLSIKLKVLEVNFINKKRALNSPLIKKLDNPHHPAFLKILALYMVFVSI